jgi:hypothetical protein
MPLATKILIASVSFLVLMTIVSLVHHKRLDEQYAFLWLAAGVIMLLAPLATPLLDQLSKALGFHYPPAFVLLLAFLGLCLINLQSSVVISRLNKHNKQLAQRLAIIDQRLREMERQKS